VLAHINAQENVIEKASTSAKFVPIDCDPGCRSILTDEDKVYVIQQCPFQPKLGRYPRNPDIHPSKQCHFSSAWFNTYPHVEYSVKKDAAFCFVCQLFPSGIGTKHDQSCKAWAEDGVKAWHKMKSRGKNKPGKLAEHFSSSSHCASLAALVAFQKKSADIDLLLDKGCRSNLIEEEAEIQHNRELIKIHLDVARTLAWQGIAFCGSSLEKDGTGNFRQIVVNLLARHSPIWRRWLTDTPKRPHRVDYLSSRSQNEYLELLAKDVLSRVITEICQAEMFAVIADTTPDVSHVDQLSVVARYVDQEGHVRECLVGMREIEDKTGEGHAQGILAALNENSTSTANIVFQSYDYMSSMSGIFKGCQAKMKENLGREVPYFPCLAHRVNTTVEHSDTNIVDTLEAAEATIATLRHLCNNEENLNKHKTVILNRTPCFNRFTRTGHALT
jgi:hypothetical protein